MTIGVFDPQKRCWGYYDEKIYREEFYHSKLIYIYLNPVRAKIVEKEEEYLNSNCGQIYRISKEVLELIEY